MLIAVERLLIRIRHPASRAREVNDLRARLRDEVAKGEHADADERALAVRIREGKRAISDALRDVSSCRTCAKGLPAPQGIHAGGACCGGATPDLFDDHEVAALALAGTGPGDLVPPAGGDVHAGCAFRGPRGCTLDIAHRPGRCVLYICETLSRELHRAGQLGDIERMLDELRQDMTASIALHAERADREVLAPLVDALEEYGRRGR